VIHSGAVVCFIWTPFFCYGTVVVVLSIVDAGGPRCPIWAMGMYKTRKCKTVKVTDYKMRKYMRNYFHSLFTFTAVSATSDCQLQTDKWSYDARPSAAALMLQSGPSFKPTYEMRDCLTLNIALLLSLLYIVALMTHRCIRVFNRPTVLPLGNGQLFTQSTRRSQFSARS